MEIILGLGRVAQAQFGDDFFAVGCWVWVVVQGVVNVVNEGELVENGLDKPCTVIFSGVPNCLFDFGCAGPVVSTVAVLGVKFK